METRVQKLIEKGKLENFQTKSKDIQVEEIEVLKDKYSNKTYTVGYNIKNNSDKPIKNVYLTTDNKLKKVNIEPFKNISLPTKWFALLLSRVHYGFKTNNGILIKKNNNLSNNIDDDLNNYIFSNESIPKKEIGQIDLINNKITNCKKLEYSFLNKSIIQNKVNINNICASAKLLGWIIQD